MFSSSRSGIRTLSVLLLMAGSALAPALHASPAMLEAEGDELTAGGRTLHIRIAPDIDAARARMLHAWIAEAARAALGAYGRFPLDEATVRVSETERRSDSPVPWGQTLRRNSVAVLLYVRKGASLEELRADWTAAHELSHLFHPYLGDDGRWLAEGLASYYQNVLRARSGLLEEADAWRRLDAGFGRGQRDDSGQRLDELSRGHRGTMRVYWAGAAYWLEMDFALRRSGSSLDDVLSRYSDCCLRGTGEVAPEAFVAQLDRIAGGTGFRDRFRNYAAMRTFPSLDASYAALGLSRSAAGLQFSDDAEASARRRTIMRRR
jgi:hypothetical protein